ncbi:tetratricopeptide repeat protein [Thiohalobacter sp.]|uniref:tetratricopeptide repeat protein n=1 Tax=Thiohalobacter sp. TaxID=2025948 RepID=UPI00261AED24|nr:tetratricopeptide repeat protein [Thiohalobacter sp.]
MSLLMDALRQAERGRAKGNDREAAAADAGRTRAPQGLPETGSCAAAEPAASEQEQGADLSLAPLDTPPEAATGADFEALDEAEAEPPEPAPQAHADEDQPVTVAEPELEPEPEAQAQAQAATEAAPAAVSPEPAPRAPGPGPEQASVAPPPQAAAELSVEAQPERVQAERLVALTRARKAAAQRRMKFMLGGLAAVILLLLAGYGYLQMSGAGDEFVPGAAEPVAIGPETDPESGVADARPEPAATMLSGPTRLRPVSGPTAKGESPSPAPVAAPDAEPPAAAAMTTPNPSANTPPPATTAAGIRIRRVVRPRPVDADLAAAFAAFGRGDLDSASERYRQVLRREPGNRDAHMGLGAVALRQGDAATARTHYREVLRRDPSDTAALAALALLEGGEQRDIGRLRVQLQRHPDDARLHFALGSLHAQAGRWAEAQRAYFEAHRLAPERPEHAFNLAVALDRLGKPQAALGFYRQARELAMGRTVAFDLQALERRIAQLSGGAGS